MPANPAPESQAAAPKVSVAIITYNHVRYITQAVESVVSQQAAFPYEVVIGDDCSTDGTRETLLDLQRRFPDKIRLILHPQNLGLLGKKNLVATFAECRGEYLAYLEGDDYWEASDKLQRQADFLDANTGFVGCFHDIKMLKGGHPPAVWRMGYPPGVTTINLREMLAHGFPHLMTMMYRRQKLSTFPDWFYEVCMGDWSVFSLLTNQGPMAYLPDWPAGIYRIHGTSYWLGKPFVERTFDEIHAYRIFLRLFAEEHHPVLRHKINRHQFWLVDAYLAKADREAARRAFWDALKDWPRHRGEPLGKVLHYSLRLYAPRLLHRLQRLRHGRPGNP
jgi:glycosyltransferase involved in cell wall biosynthesis